MPRPPDGQTPLRPGRRFYLCAHDARGRPLLPAPVIGIGTASAIFGDLILIGYLIIVDDHFQLLPRARALLQETSSRGRPTAYTSLLHDLFRNPKVTVRGWTADLAPYAPHWIAHRLEAHGHVREVNHPRLLRRTPPRYEPVDRNAPNHLGDRLLLALSGRSSLTLLDMFEAGLLQATQLHRSRLASLPDLDDVIDHELRKLGTSELTPRTQSLCALLVPTRALATAATHSRTPADTNRIYV
ncbi:GPP34 family phosphoprotein [Lentzea sp. NPDC102401]|uniref:GPP34 family phosphoprotein n=1 Tax=Lentzea sp. NPDC102401 TaxID=3364128 RepID=UPI0037F8989C